MQLVMNLSAVHSRYCIVLDDVVSEYVASLTQKNPKQKAETLRLLATVVGTSAKKDAAKAGAMLLPVVAKLAAEPTPDIREAAMQVLSIPPFYISPKGHISQDKKACPCVTIKHNLRCGRILRISQ